MDLMTPIKDDAGKVMAVTTVSRNITERHELEEALYQNEAELAAIYNNLPLAIMLVDAERRMRKVNDVAARFADRIAEEMAGLRGGEEPEPQRVQ